MNQIKALTGKYGENALSEILDNKELIEQIMNKKLNKNMTGSSGSSGQTISHYSTHSNNQRSSSIKTYSVGEGCISINFDTNIISNTELYNFYRNTLDSIMKYGEDFDFTNPVNEATGITGEAYIYELLLKSNKFKKVTWMKQRNSGQTFDYIGNIYSIDKNDGTHFDIKVETLDGNIKYIEVKSTRRQMGNKVPFYIS